MIVNFHRQCPSVIEGLAIAPHVSVNAIVHVVREGVCIAEVGLLELSALFRPRWFPIGGRTYRSIDGASQHVVINWCLCEGCLERHSTLVSASCCFSSTG
jgi:hypothetical protein